MGRIKEGFGLDDAYKFYKDKHGPKVDKSTYRKICYEFNKMMVDDVLEGKVVKVPHRLGELWIKKYKIDLDNPPIDLNETKKAGKIVYHLNQHSDGYQCRWSWSKRNNLVTNMIYYSFHATRANSRELAKIMKQPGGHKRYFS